MLLKPFPYFHVNDHLLSPPLLDFHGGPKEGYHCKVKNKLRRPTMFVKHFLCTHTHTHTEREREREGERERRTERDRDRERNTHTHSPTGVPNTLEL